MRKRTSFRLDISSAARLEEISKKTQYSQSDILNMLIDGCFDVLWAFESGETLSSVKGFGRVAENIKFRLGVIANGEA